MIINLSSLLILLNHNNSIYKGDIMIFLSELKNLLNAIDTSVDDPKIVTRNRVGKEGTISLKKFGKDEIKYVERNGVEVTYDKENAILYIDS